MKNTIKKIISMVLATMMLVLVGITAFASPDSGTPIGSQEEQDAYSCARYLKYLEQEEPLWDYGEDRQYIAPDGTVWEYWPGEKLNWIRSAENPDFIYRILEDGTLYVGGGTKDLNVKIPATLDGKTVTMLNKIGTDKTLSVTIPDTVTEIGYDCFAGDTSIKRFIIGSNVKVINDRAFDLVDDAEIYFCGTEEQWNDVIVWHQTEWGEKHCWVVTEYDWTVLLSDEGENYSWISAVYYNADASTFEDLVPEEKPATSNSFFDQLLAGASSIVVTVVSFFKRIGDLIIQIF